MSFAAAKPEAGYSHGDGSTAAPHLPYTVSLLADAGIESQAGDHVGAAEQVVQGDADFVCKGLGVEGCSAPSMGGHVVRHRGDEAEMRYEVPAHGPINTWTWLLRMFTAKNKATIRQRSFLSGGVTWDV